VRLHSDRSSCTHPTLADLEAEIYDPHFAKHFYDNRCLRTLAALTVLSRLDLSICEEVSDDGLRTLAVLTALIALSPALPGRNHHGRRGV
jgi:hypothetical protein